MFSPHKKIDHHDYVQTEAESPVKRIADFEPPKITKYQTKKADKKVTAGGRKLEYPQQPYYNYGDGAHKPKKQERPHSAMVASKSS